MTLFPCGHATHPQWRMACGLVLAQLRAQMALPDHASAPTLGLLYITDHYADQAGAILDCLQAELPEVADWAGTVGVGVCAPGAEYIDEPALSVLLCELPNHAYRVFSGVAPLAGGHGFVPHTALIHADARTPDLAELIVEMAERTQSGYLFGGLSASRREPVQFAVSGSGNVPGQGRAGGVFSGGLSGVAFGADVTLLSRVSQGCQPVAPEREITALDGNLLLALDGEPALDVLLRDLGFAPEAPSAALERMRRTLVGLSGAGATGPQRRGNFGADVVVRHIIGIDPVRRGVAIAARPAPGQRAAFCQRDAQAARADLMRICAEIREELEPEELTETVAVALAAHQDRAAPHPARRIRGAVYVSCAGRGGPHFGAPNAELQVLRHALGDVPLVGFFAGGEIARHHLYGYTGVLTVFVADASADD
ncbi:MAG: FIST C-terminal domain-containing protein [Burkholderiales bacterium]|nr:FIST C-terminal domain-containing protein [Burkholderiales bacterium]MBK8664410.1 FIST C-terminal domain-containing protein [Burkholderiales bacterium]